MPQSRSSIADALRDPILASHLSHQEMEDFLIARVTPFQVPEADRWESEAEEVRSQVLKDVIFKGIPSSWYEGKPEVVWTDTIETAHGYSIKKLRYEALPNLWVPALLYEPDVISSPVPSVLNLNGHVGPPGKAIDYKQIRCINLAKRGIIALNPEWLFFGELRTDGYTHNQAGHLDLAGAAGVGVFYLCMLRGLDILADHEATDPDRLAVTGLSGGGWQTIILSSLDKRVTLAAPNAGYIGLESRARFRGDIGDIEQNPADLVATADYPVLTAMMAPRPTLLLYNDQDDCCFRTERAHPSVYLPVKPLFEAMGVPENLAFHNNTDPGTHNYDLDHRQQFYGFLNRHFFNDENIDDTELDSDGEVLSEETLTVGIPAGNADFLSLATDFHGDLPRFRLPTGSRDQLDEWLTSGRDHLARLLRYEALKVSHAQSEPVDQSGEYRLVRSSLNLDDVWSLPVVEFSKSDAPSDAVLVIADEGRSSMADGISGLLSTAGRVYVTDLTMQGECRPVGTPVHQFSMMFSTIGSRILGVQAAQLAAIASWVAKQAGCNSVRISASGPISSVIALCAAACSAVEMESLTLSDSFVSLKQLTEEAMKYDDFSSLFCFGLLEAFDLRELIGLCAPIPVHLTNVRADGDRTAIELEALRQFATSMEAPEFRLPV